MSSYACLTSLFYASAVQLPLTITVQMANRPTGVDEAIDFIWNQPDTVLQSLEKQRLNAVLAKETDVVPRRYFLAPLPELKTISYTLNPRWAEDVLSTLLLRLVVWWRADCH